MLWQANPCSDNLLGATVFDMLSQTHVPYVACFSISLFCSQSGSKNLVSARHQKRPASKTYCKFILENLNYSTLYHRFNNRVSMMCPDQLHLILQSNGAENVCVCY